MAYQSEAALEQQFIEQLNKQEYTTVAIPDYDALVENFKVQFEAFNAPKLDTPITDKEWERIFNLMLGKSVFQSAKILRDKFVLEREDGTKVYLSFFDQDHTKNIFQVTHQTTVVGKYVNRYDVTILVNGLPLIQVELKRRGIDIREAVNQVMRYKKHSYNGLYHFIQLFIVSNGVDTKYFANSDRDLMYSLAFFWTDFNNVRITNLKDFSISFLARDHIIKMLTRYTILNDTDKILMVMRPYQVYAVVNGTESNRVPLQVLPERQLDTLTVNGTIPNLIYNDDTANTFDLSTLDVEAKDQYGEDMTLDDGLFEWRLATDKGYAEISGSVITGLVVGTDTVTLYYPVGQDKQGETVYRTAQPLPVQVTAKPYLNELYYNDGAPAAVEGAEYDLSRIPLLARDQHGNPCGIPSDIEWTLADTNQTNATIENGKLLVAVGSVPDASYADVILEASSASAGKTAKNVVVKVEQQPTLKTIRADMKDGFVLRLDENAVLADQFTAAGYDQYGREMTGGSFEWVISKPDVVSLENGTLKALKEDSTEIYARSGDIESNHITLTVNAPRRLTAITADGIPSSVRKNTTLDLSAAKVTTLDQFGKAFTPEELAAYPASVRWTLEKNDTHAVISGNTLSFGDQDGTMTLICAAVNADTNVIVEKKIIIRITDSTSGGGSSGGGGGGGGGGFSAPSYAVSVDDVKHGTVTVSPKSASKGDTVTITATPDKGYTLESLTVLDKDGKALEMTDKGGGKYTFVMPAGKVTVKAVFMDDNTMLNFFTDVHAEDYYYDAVLWAAQKGITGGMSDTLFAPNAACTRAQIVTFLWRAAGSPEPKQLSTFGDVPADAYYAKAVAWAVENGITEGTSDTTFAPGTICTRAQGAALLYRAAGSPAVSGSAAFTDVPADAYYADAAAWAEQKGITGGIGNGLFGPHNNCTRAQIVTFLYRLYGSK